MVYVAIKTQKNNSLFDDLFIGENKWLSTWILNLKAIF